MIAKKKFSDLTDDEMERLFDVPVDLARLRQAVRERRARFAAECDLDGLTDHQIAVLRSPLLVDAPGE